MPKAKPSAAHDEEHRFLEIQVAALKEGEAIKRHFFEPGIRVLGVSGSARDPFDMAQEASTTEWLLEKCLDEAKSRGAETKLLQLRKKWTSVTARRAIPPPTRNVISNAPAIPKARTATT